MNEHLDLQELVGGSRANSGWEAPVPLDTGPALPAFPVDALPGWLADFVGSVAVATQTPADMAGVMVLGALAAAAGGRAVVQPRPGWSEPTNLYEAVAMAPGNRKSAVVEVVTRPLRSAERDAIEKLAAEIGEAKTTKAIAEEKAKTLARKAAQAASNDADDAADLQRAAVDAAAMAEQVTVPTMPRILADDTTPEALSTVMAAQDGRLAVISAEGGIFDIIGGRYSKMPNFDIYLKAHAGDEIRVDRVGRKPEHIERPALTLALAVQPAVLRTIADREGFRGRGLLARFLFVLPTSFVGRREIGAPPVPAEIGDRYERLLKEMVLTLAEWTDPQVLSFASDANEALLDYERALEPQLGAGGDLEHLADWGAKLAGAVVRIAGLLHLASRPTTGYREPIDRDTFTAAARIGDFFLAHSRAVHTFMGSDGVLDDARALHHWARAHRTFSKRDAHRALAHRFERSESLDPPLALLEDRGWLRRQPDPPMPRGWSTAITGLRRSSFAHRRQNMTVPTQPRFCRFSQVPSHVEA